MKTWFLLLLTALLSFAPPALAEECNLANLYGTASASNEASAYPASNSVDDDLTTFWNMGADPSQYLQVDLGSSWEITSVDVCVQQSSTFTQDTDLSYSNDGSTWVNVATWTGATSDGDCLNYTGDVTARYLRYTVESSPSQSGVYEFTANTDCGNVTDSDGDGFVLNDDCDDENASAYPGAPEIWYDGIDEDCNDSSDFDADGDGYDSQSYGGEDCDDANVSVNPGAAEVDANGVDDDCDGYDGDEPVLDADGDGYNGEEFGGDDCDDANSSVYPGAEEIWYNGIDEDCNGGSDGDADGDGDGSKENRWGLDCDDTDPDINSDEEEIRTDGIDQNCNGDEDEDVDGDGYSVREWDCDDTDPTAYPQDIESSATDNVDNDCDDEIDELEGGYPKGGGGFSCSTSTNSSLLGVLVGLLGLIGLRRRV